MSKGMVYAFAVGFLAAKNYGLWPGLLVATVVILCANAADLLTEYRRKS